MVSRVDNSEEAEEIKRVLLEISGKFLANLLLSAHRMSLEALRMSRQSGRQWCRHPRISAEYSVLADNLSEIIAYESKETKSAARHALCLLVRA